MPGGAGRFILSEGRQVKPGLLKVLLPTARLGTIWPRCRQFPNRSAPFLELARRAGAAQDAAQPGSARDAPGSL